MTHLASIVVGSALVAAVAGCAVGPAYERPDLGTSADWRNAPRRDEPVDRWWEGFNSTTLNVLEREALTGDLDLEAALARIDQARGTLGSAGGALAPSAEIDGAGGRSKQSLNSGLGRLSRFVPSFGRTIDVAQLDLAASWDIDFAGGLSRRREAAAAGVADAQARWDAARVALIADLADAYVVLRGDEAQLRAARAYAALLAELRDIAAARVAVRAGASADLARSAAAADDAAALVPSLEALVDGQRNRIAVLVGRDPSRTLDDVVAPEDLAAVPDPAAGRPVDVIRRRPDVRAAEARLVAANADIGAALAEYYPRFTLSAFVGQFTNRFATFHAADSTAEQGLVGLRWRLFDFARIDGEVGAARGRERESRVAYRQAVLLATENVETSFSQLAGARAREAVLAAERSALVDAVRSAAGAFRVGEISREARLDAERLVARLDLDVAASRRDVARAVVACERALGAGAEDGTTSQRSFENGRRLHAP